MQKIRVLFTICWIAFIFFQSFQTGEISIEMSNKLVNPLVEMIEQKKSNIEKSKIKFEEPTKNSISEEIKVPDSSKIDTLNKDKVYKKVNYFVRKSAHVIEYAILATVVLWMFKGFSISSINQLIYTLFLVILIAVLDEYAQSFVARTSSVSDVILDFVSGIGSLLIIKLIDVIRNSNRMIS